MHLHWSATVGQRPLKPSSVISNNFQPFSSFLKFSSYFNMFNNLIDIDNWLLVYTIELRNMIIKCTFMKRVVQLLISNILWDQIYRMFHNVKESIQEMPYLICKFQTLCCVNSKMNKEMSLSLNIKAEGSNKRIQRTNLKCRF